jgi:hypothetical protein
MTQFETIAVESPGAGMAQVWRNWLPALALAAVASLYGWLVFVTTFGHPGKFGLDYNAPGSDWMSLYDAVRGAMAGQWALLADGERFTAHLNADFANILSEPLAFRPFVYPPTFLVLLQPFAGLGFWGSYAAFQLTGAALLCAGLAYRPDQPRSAWLVIVAALLCPAAAINVVDGQCSFLVAGILVLGMRLLRRHGFAAGLVLGVLSFKPQFAVLVPVALVAGRQWTALAGAALMAVGLAAASLAMFGLAPWAGWLAQTRGAFDLASLWVRAGRLWGNSVYACAFLLGASGRVASWLQLLAALTGAAFVAAAYRSRSPDDHKLAVLLAATILAAPHSGAYDAMLLVIAAGLVLAPVACRQTAGMGTRMLFLALWLIPTFSPPVLDPASRIGPLLILWFLLATRRRSSDGTIAT